MRGPPIPLKPQGQNMRQSPFGTDVLKYKTITAYSWEDTNKTIVKVRSPDLCVSDSFWMFSSRWPKVCNQLVVPSLLRASFFEVARTGVSENSKIDSCMCVVVD